MEERLPTELWVAAHLRRLAAAAIPAYVVRKGAPAGGTVIVRLALANKGNRLLTQSRDMEGNLGWMDPFESEAVDDKRADYYIERAISRDPDVWVIEVEDKSGQNPFEGKIF